MRQPARRFPTWQGPHREREPFAWNGIQCPTPKKHPCKGGVHHMGNGMDTLVRVDTQGRGLASNRALGRPLDRPSRTEAEQAARTLIRWAGDDPSREGLLDTPARVARAYEQWFAGYSMDPGEHLARTFEEVSGYDEMVVLRDIRFVSHCEHHMAP